MARKSRYVAEVKEEKKTAMLLAGVYTRLSIEDEDDEEQNSIGNQKKIALDYLKDKDDIAVTEYYVDNGYTGMNFSRPDFQRMMNDLRSGKINCVIVKDISRLGRHFVMTSEFVEKIFPMMGVRLICINDDYDSFDENCDSASLLLPFKMVMNDSYVKDISKKIRSSISAKMDSGEYLPSASSIPFGYIRNPEQNTFDIDEEVAPVVVRIFEMRANGVALNAIAKTLNEEGIPCPGKLRYLRGITKAAKYENALWIHGTLRKILMDQVYIGNRVHGRVKRDKLGMEKTRRSEEEWQVIENAHQPIISQELFDKVQEAMNEAASKRNAYKQQEAPETDHREVFREKVYCGDCGSMMRGCKGLGRANEDGERKAFIYYDCGKFLDSGRAVCSAHYVRQEEIMDTLRNALDTQLCAAIDFEALVKEVQAMPKVVHYESSVKNQLTSIQSKRRHMELRLEQLIVDLTDGLIDKQEYAYAKQKYNEEYEHLLEEENRLFTSSRRLGNIVASSDKWIRTLKEYRSIPDIDRKAVDFLVKRIKIYPGKRIELILNYEDPFRLVSEYLNQIPEVVENVG